MSRNINELAEIVLDRVYKLGYQHRSEIEEGCKVADELLAVERKLGDAERERDKLAAENETLRQDCDHWWQARQDAIEAGDLMQAEIETLRQRLGNAQRELSEQGQVHGVELQRETADLREQLNAAQAALTRERLDAEERGEKLDRLREDHARLGRLVQARGQELEGQHQELVRLRVFVKVMRGLLTEEYADQRIIAEALAELDAEGGA